MITATTTDHEIWEIVMKRFPRIPTEWTCRTEHLTRMEVRESYKKRLEDEREAAQRILDQSGADAITLGQQV
jgi:hypothetical protein